MYTSDMVEVTLMSKKTKFIIRFVLKIILYIVGIIIFFSAKNSATASAQDQFDRILTMVFGYALTGIFCGIAGWKTGEEGHELHEKHHGVMYHITDSGIYRDEGGGYKLLMFIIFMAFGPIGTPISCIIDIIRLATNDVD